MAAALEHEISAGRWAAGSRIPSEPELCKSFGISRSVVRQALQRLEQEGLIIRRKGFGTYVAESRPRSWLLQSSDGFFQDEADRHGRRVTSRILRLELAPLPNWASDALDLPEDSRRRDHGAPALAGRPGRAARLRSPARATGQDGARAQGRSQRVAVRAHQAARRHRGRRRPARRRGRRRRAQAGAAARGRARAIPWPSSSRCSGIASSARSTASARGCAPTGSASRCRSRPAGRAPATCWAARPRPCRENEVRRARRAPLRTLDSNRTNS